MSDTYALSAWLFARALAAVYIVAFLSLSLQCRGLWGGRGVLPASEYLKAVAQVTEVPSRYFQLPTVFWLGASDTVLIAAAVFGIAAALLALVGVAQGWMFLLCFVLYLSFVNAGQEFMQFQWDVLLLEVGLLILFVVPWSWRWSLGVAFEPHWVWRFLFYAVLFKLMFLSGVVKLQSGDPAWRDLSALSYHFWTQPLPNPLSPFFHRLPLWCHQMFTLGTFVVELALPFLIWFPGTRAWAAVGFVFLSAFIFLTGNYTFFNLLTAALCIWLVPDSFWQRFLDLPVELVPVVDPRLAPLPVAVAAVLALTTLFWCTRWFLPGAVARLASPALEWLEPWHISNSYGLFATMTKTRPEIVFEGSDDGHEWKEYELRYKPGPLNRMPPVIEPLQPRLDWQLWFAALGTFHQSPWLSSLMTRIIENSPDVLVFFSYNPFPDHPPRYLRARLYEYEFATGEGGGNWWQRHLINETYSPTFQR